MQRPLRPTLAAIPVLAAILAAAPAPAAGPHDGTWKGSYRTIRNDNSGRCDKLDNDNVTIQVVDGRFSRTWAGNQLDIAIAADGSVNGSTNRAQTARVQRVIVFQGRIANGVMEGEYGHDRCAVRFSLRRVQ